MTNHPNRKNWTHKVVRHSLGLDGKYFDRKVLEFVKGHVFHSADFIIRLDGVCRLNPEMARVVVATMS